MADHRPYRGQTLAKQKLGAGPLSGDRVQHTGDGNTLYTNDETHPLSDFQTRFILRTGTGRTVYSDFNLYSIAKPEAAYTSTKTAGAPCPMDPPASLAPVQNPVNFALREISYSIRRRCDQLDHVGATSAISYFGLPDFSQTVLSDARKIYR